MDNSEESQIIVAASDDLQETASQPPYLKLIADCWEHIFDYLSFRDILKMGQTCKRMNQLVGYYLLANHPELKFLQVKKDMQLFNSFIPLRASFHKFIAKLHIYNIKQFNIDFIQNMKTFDSLKTIIFSGSHVTGTQISCMRNILKNIETIVLLVSMVNGNTFEQLAIHCSKLKDLNINQCRNVDGALILNSFFSLNFPLLERLRIQSCLDDTDIQIDELKIFLVKHKNLKNLSIDSRFFWANRDSFNRANIRLDSLNIYFDTRDIIIPFDQFVSVLMRIYEHKTYETLHISFVQNVKIVHHEHFKNAISILAPALQNLRIFDNSFVDLTGLTDLKQLVISYFAVNVEIIAKSLTKLERLFLSFANFNDILPFIRHSKRLKTIKIFRLSEDILDAFALNEERKKFGNKRKVTIYMPEMVYLPTKWLSQNSNLDLIGIRRVGDMEIFLGFDW